MGFDKESKIIFNKYFFVISNPSTFYWEQKIEKKKNKKW